MVMVELVPVDLRLGMQACPKCELPFAGGDRVFLSRLGLAIHVDCVFDLAEEVCEPMQRVQAEYEDTRRELLGE